MLETGFEKRARNLLKRLDPDGLRRGKLPRPFIVEVTGSPDSGKTTTLKILDSFFRRQEYKGKKYNVWKPLEGAEAVRDIPRSSHIYNVATGNYALQILIQHSFIARHDLILFDRCVYDAWCWMEYWFRKKDISKETANYFKSFFSHSAWRNNIDICFFIMCNPKIAIQRDQQWSLTKKAGSFTNLETVTQLYNIFKGGYNYFKEKDSPVSLIDTTNLNPQEAARMVFERFEFQ